MATNLQKKKKNSAPCCPCNGNSAKCKNCVCVKAGRAVSAVANVVLQRREVVATIHPFPIELPVLSLRCLILSLRGVKTAVPWPWM